jgi:hypothetical protein
MTTFLEKYDLREESTDSYSQREKLLRWILSALRQVVLPFNISQEKVFEFQFKEYFPFFRNMTTIEHYEDKKKIIFLS